MLGIDKISKLGFFQNRSSGVRYRPHRVGSINLRFVFSVVATGEIGI
jgi:hypothetical protein